MNVLTGYVVGVSTLDHHDPELMERIFPPEEVGEDSVEERKRFNEWMSLDEFADLTQKAAVAFAAGDQAQIDAINERLKRIGYFMTVLNGKVHIGQIGGNND